MNFKICKCYTQPIRLSDGEKYSFYICDDREICYLCRDGSLRTSCNENWNDISISGWYKTKEEAEAMLEKYLSENKKNRLTAQQAKELAGETVEEKVDKLLIAVEKAAKAKKRKLRTGWDYQPDKDLWIDGGYSTTKEWKEAKKILEDLGYEVTFYYNECQFVDMYTLIEW